MAKEKWTQTCQDQGKANKQARKINQTVKNARSITNNCTQLKLILHQFHDQCTILVFITKNVFVVLSTSVGIPTNIELSILKVVSK